MIMVNYLYRFNFPKMVFLYQDPKGDRVGTSTAGITTVITQTGPGTANNVEWENKIASLEKMIVELKTENETLKVSNSYTIA